MPPFALFLAGLLAGAGALAVAPRLAPWLRDARPALKAGLKLAIGAIDDARVAAAELAETAEDLYAEAAAEVAAERETTARKAPAPAAPKRAGRKAPARRRRAAP